MPETMLKEKASGSRRRSAKLNVMAVGVWQENLEGAVRPRASRKALYAAIIEMAFPGVHVVHHQGEMVSAAGRHHFPFSLAYQMQLLVDAQAKPGAGKIECGPRQRLELKNIAIKRDTSSTSAT